MHLAAVALSLIMFTTTVGESFVSPLLNKRRVQSTTMRTSMSTAAPTKQRATIVGGGPAGALMAIFLARDGRFEVDLFEGREGDQIAGPKVRSYNVVFMRRGLDALNAAGIDLAEVAAEFDRAAIKMTGAVRHHANPKPNENMFMGSYSLCRGDAAIALLRKADSLANVKVHFGCKLVAVDLEQRIATFDGGDGEHINRSYDMLVGADGVNSKVRSELAANVPDFTVSQEKDPMAFKTIRVPIMEWKGATESWKTCFHTYNSKNGCMLAPPRGDEDLAAVIIQPGEGSQSFNSLMKTAQDVKDFFVKNYPTAFGKEGPNEELAKKFLDLRPAQMMITYCSRLNHDSVVLIGDAAHSMLASLGQGVQTALEDCKVLSGILGETSTPESGELDIPAALKAYNMRRHEDVVAACKMSNLGFGGGRSMRPGFIAQLVVVTILNKTIGRLFPKTFTPPSIMRVSKSDWSYGKILRGMKREAKILKIVAGVAIGAVAVAARFFFRR